MELHLSEEGGEAESGGGGSWDVERVGSASESWGAAARGGGTRVSRCSRWAGGERVDGLRSPMRR